MKDRSGATAPRTHQTTHSGHVESVSLLNLGFVPDQHPLPSSTTYMDRHMELHHLTQDPAAALLDALAAWLHVTADHTAQPVALVQAMDLTHNGTVTENIGRRQAALLAQLLRSDTALRTAHRIPTAPFGAQR